MKVKVGNCVICIYSDIECVDYDIISSFKLYKKMFENEIERVTMPIDEYPVLTANYNFSNGITDCNDKINVNLEKFVTVLENKKLTEVLKNMIDSGIYKIIITQ